MLYKPTIDCHTVIPDLAIFGAFGYSLCKIMTKLLIWLLGNFGWFIKLAKTCSKRFYTSLKTDLEQVLIFFGKFATFWSSFVATMLSYNPKKKYFLLISNDWKIYLLQKHFGHTHTVLKNKPSPGLHRHQYDKI